MSTPPPTEQHKRIVRFVLWASESPFGNWLLIRHTRAFFVGFIIFTQAFYWLTAWWSPIPYLVFMLLGLWAGQGLLRPWITVIRQAITPGYDPWFLKVGVPFIALNYISFFACLYMFGSVVDSSGQRIEGVWSHFYFSTVTLTTLGYGNLVPSDAWGEFVVVVESLVGFMGFAILTGIVATIAIKRVEGEDN